MGQQKARSIAQRFGFQDPDLTSPVHDRMVAWCLDRDNAALLAWKALDSDSKVNQMSFQQCHSAEADADRCDFDWERPGCTGKCFSFAPNYCKKEHKSQEAFAADIQASIDKCPRSRKEQMALFRRECLDEVNAEYAIMSGNFNVGFLDVMLHIFPVATPVAPLTCRSAADIAIEVKTTIKSMGETLRQINLYRSHLKGLGAFLLVATPNNFSREGALSKAYRKLWIEQGVQLISLEVLPDGSLGEFGWADGDKMWRYKKDKILGEPAEIRTDDLKERG